VSREQRHAGRHPFEGPLRVFWETEDGGARYLKGEAEDLSESGISLIVQERIPLRTVVCVEALEKHSRASATVRRCDQIGLRYRVGLEFTHGSNLSRTPKSYD
jgi:hypothetical protein